MLNFIPTAIQESGTPRPHRVARGGKECCKARELLEIEREDRRMESQDFYHDSQWMAEDFLRMLVNIHFIVLELVKCDAYEDFYGQSHTL